MKTNHSNLAILAFLLLPAVVLLVTASPISAAGDSAIAAAPKSLTIRFDEVRSSKNGGNIVIGIFDNAAAHKNMTDPVVSAIIPATHVSVSFHNLPDNAYSVIAYHDKNNNETFDMSDGYPTEGYAISGATSRFDEPSFEAATIKSSGELTLTMYYLK